MADSVRFAQSDPASLWAARQIGIKNLDSVNDVRAINDYLKNNETPWDRQTREANQQRDAIASQMRRQTRNFQRTVRDISASNAASIDAVTSNLQQNFQERVNSLALSFQRERNQFNNAFAALQGQYDRQNQAFNDLNLQYTQLNEQNAEQQRLAANASRASVTTTVQSAELPLSGDQREGDSMRKGTDNTLSNLTVLTGLGVENNATSGLQLA